MATIKVRGVLKGALVLCVLAAFWNGACSTSEPVPPHPGIQVTPATVSFNDTVGASAPGPQPITIAADGPGTLTGIRAAIDYGSGAAGWLSVSLSDTTAPATLTVRSANTGLNAASYRATVNVTGTGSPNSPQAIPVTFNLAAAPPITGVTIVATANMGRCGSDLAKESALAVAAANPDYVFVLGSDATPESGKVTTLQDYMKCYDPVWGQFMNKTYATLGDHEVDIDSTPPYGTGMAAGADAYFGAARVGPPGKNWQRFDLGSWH